MHSSPGQAKFKRSEQCFFFAFYPSQSLPDRFAMISPFPSSHVLIVETEGEPQFIELTSAAYTLGRAPSNNIVLQEQAISRQHAMLLRVESPESERFFYKVIDGDNLGKPSLNGIKVNRKNCKETVLSHMDEIEFGGIVKAYYYMPQDLSGFNQELGFSPYTLHDIKTDGTDAKQTVLVSAMLEDFHLEPSLSNANGLGLWEMPYCFDDLFNEDMTAFLA